MPHTFTCDACHGLFETDKTDEECAEDYRADFPGGPLPPRDRIMQLCDDCYATFRLWFEAQPAERLRRMRERGR